jgi:hypothetical protein
MSRTTVGTLLKLTIGQRNGLNSFMKKTEGISQGVDRTGES